MEKSIIVKLLVFKKIKKQIIPVMTQVYLTMKTLLISGIFMKTITTEELDLVLSN